MALDDSDILSEEEAAELWARAAQLQAEAAKNVETPEVHGAELPPAGYALAHVRSAALEAGIGDEFVDAALADLRAERAIPMVQSERSFAHKFLGDPPNTITVRRVIEATPQEVLTAMEAVFPEEPYRLTLTDQQGDPLDRGPLIFDVSGAGNAFSQGGFTHSMRESGLKQVFVSLRPIEGSMPSCEMTVYSPVTSHKLGLGVGGLLSTLGGGIGVGIGTVIGNGIFTAGVALGLAVLVPIGGFLVGGGLSLKGYRALYRYALRQGRKSLEGLVGAVAVRTRGVWKG